MSARDIVRSGIADRAGIAPPGLVPGLLQGLALGLALVLALVLAAGPALGHAAFVQVTEARAVTIHARYDTGEPMAGAQVAVFAPDAPARPWSTGLTDGEGRFTFVPDSRPGRWAVQARQAGHGAMGYIEWPPGDAPGLVPPVAQGGGPDLVQRLIMAASLAWGCIGTALYFRRRRRGGPG